MLVLTFYFSVSVSDFFIRPDMFVGCFEVEVSRGLGFLRHAYLKSFSPVPSSHCGRFTLILCTNTLDPRMQCCVACNKLVEIILLMYLHGLE